MRRQRRPDLMTMLWWIAATGVLLSTWTQARADDDLTTKHAASYSSKKALPFVLRLASEPSGMNNTARLFARAGRQDTHRAYDLSWNLSHSTGPLTQLDPGDAYVLIGVGWPLR